eukprot:1394155-Amorphochlora_amoeboformis.AAC.1
MALESKRDDKSLPKDAVDPSEIFQKFSDHSFWVKAQLESLHSKLSLSEGVVQSFQHQISGLKEEIKYLKRVISDRKRSAAQIAAEKEEKETEVNALRASRLKPSLQKPTRPKLSRTRRPVGRAPKGKRWDYDLGKWVEKESVSPTEDFSNKSNGVGSRNLRKAVQSKRLYRRVGGRGMVTRAVHRLVYTENKDSGTLRKYSADSRSSPRSTKRLRLDMDGIQLLPLEPVAPSPSYYKRPRGAPPKGKTWNYRTGEWVDDLDDEESSVNNSLAEKVELWAHER